VAAAAGAAGLAHGRGDGWRRRFRAYAKARGQSWRPSGGRRAGRNHQTQPGLERRMARASNCCNFSTPGGWSIRRRSPKGASFPRRLFLEGGGNSRPGPVLLRHPRATFGADDGSRTRMAEGRGILSPLRLPVSPRPLAAMGFNGASTGRQAPFGAARGKSD
jgi:hypothetical protein